MHKRLYLNFFYIKTICQNLNLKMNELKNIKLILKQSNLVFIQIKYNRDYIVNSYYKEKNQVVFTEKFTIKYLTINNLISMFVNVRQKTFINLVLKTFI